MTRRPTAPPPRQSLFISIVCAIVFAVLFAVFVLLNAGCSLKHQQIAHVGLQASDLVSTYYGEQAGGYEANPFAPDSWSGRIAIKAAVTAGVVYMTHRLEKAGHGSVAKKLLIVVNTIVAGVVVNNVLVSAR